MSKIIALFNGVNDKTKGRFYFWNGNVIAFIMAITFVYYVIDAPNPVALVAVAMLSVFARLIVFGLAYVISKLMKVVGLFAETYDEIYQPNNTSNSQIKF